VAALLLIGAGIAGCAGREQVQEQPPRWGTYQADVMGVRKGPDERTLLIDVQVAGGHPDCSRNPQVTQYTEENGLIYANVVYESARADMDGGCPDRETAVATLTAPQPIGDRRVVLNQQIWALNPVGDGYRRCHEQLGCTPPADPCDPVWTRYAKDRMDVPRHSYYNVESCGGGWLVMTVDANSAACGAAPRPGCSAPPDTTRYFLRFDSEWRIVAGSRTGGCDAVLKVDPSFPRERCEGLPPTR
jgi:hypothetical protein